MTTENWKFWDYLETPPVPNAIRTIRGWEAPMTGTKPEDGMYELIVCIRYRQNDTDQINDEHGIPILDETASTITDEEV